MITGAAGYLGSAIAHALRLGLVLRTGPRRIGEHDCAPAAVGVADELFGWRPQRDLAASVAAAVRWHRLQSQAVSDDTRENFCCTAGNRISEG